MYRPKRSTRLGIDILSVLTDELLLLIVGSLSTLERMNLAHVSVKFNNFMKDRNISVFNDGETVTKEQRDVLIFLRKHDAVYPNAMEIPPYYNIAKILFMYALTSSLPILVISKDKGLITNVERIVDSFLIYNIHKIMCAGIKKVKLYLKRSKIFYCTDYVNTLDVLLPVWRRIFFINIDLSHIDSVGQYLEKATYVFTSRLTTKKRESSPIHRFRVMPYKGDVTIRIVKNSTMMVLDIYQAFSLNNSLITEKLKKLGILDNITDIRYTTSRCMGRTISQDSIKNIRACYSDIIQYINFYADPRASSIMLYIIIPSDVLNGEKYTELITHISRHNKITLEEWLYPIGDDGLNLNYLPLPQGDLVFGHIEL